MLQCRTILRCDHSTVDAFAEDLRVHGGDPGQVKAVCFDISKAYIVRVICLLPDAAMTFDAFHVIGSANQPVDHVQRRELVWAKALTHSRWIWLKDHRDLTAEQTGQFQSLSRNNLETARAWRLKEAQRALYADAPSRERADAELTGWYSWASRCRLEPFKRLPTTIKVLWEADPGRLRFRANQRPCRRYERFDPG